MPVGSNLAHGVPCFPESKTRLILTFTLKYNTGTYFWELFFIFIYQKTKLQSSELSDF